MKIDRKFKILILYATLAFGATLTLFCRLANGEEKFIQPCPDAGGYYSWLGGPNKNHLGHDYNAPIGTEVKAIAYGTVFKVVKIVSKCYDPKTKSELSQTFVWIRHRLQNGRYFYALYGHIEPYENIKEGAEIKVEKGIGIINNCYVWYKSKLVPSPHLHFGIWNSESPPSTKEIGYGPVRSFVNPINFLQENKPYAVSTNKTQPIIKNTQSQISSSLRIVELPPYKVGQTITAQFSIKNIGTASITFDVLTVGGRVNDICPEDKCPDFEWKENILLRPNEAYPYKGKLKLEAPGNYHFFTAYRTKDGWNTAIPTAPGVTNTVDIKVVPYSTSKEGSELTDVVNFEVPLSKNVNGFTYAQSGFLMYQGRRFYPSVTANINDVRKFKVSCLKSKGLAAAIAIDVDGKNKLFFIDLSKGTSIQVEPRCAASDIFWSPSQKYMVVLCSYEGQWFLSIDLDTKNIMKGGLLGPSNKIWLL